MSCVPNGGKRSTCDLRDRNPIPDECPDVIPDNAYQNQLRALRSLSRTSRAVPRVGSGESERDRRFGCAPDRVREKVHARSFGVVVDGLGALDGTKGRLDFGCVAARGRGGRGWLVEEMTDWEFVFEAVDENLFFCADRAVTAAAATVSLGVPTLAGGKVAAAFVECLTLASVSSAKEGVGERKETKPEPDDENGLRETNLSNDCVREPERLRDLVESRRDGVRDGVFEALAGKGVDEVAGW